jgi:hypothetical protein
MSQPRKERRKTDVRIGDGLLKIVDEYCDFLGITKNSFIAFAVSRLCSEVALLEPSARKRQMVLADLKRGSEETLAKIEKSLR